MRSISQPTAPPRRSSPPTGRPRRTRGAGSRGSSSSAVGPLAIGAHVEQQHVVDDVADGLRGRGGPSRSSGPRGRAGRRAGRAARPRCGRRSRRTARRGPAARRCWASARATKTRWRWPPESWPIWRRAKPVMPIRSSAASTIAAVLAAQAADPARRGVAAHLDDLADRDREVPVDGLALGHVGHPPHRLAGAGGPRTVDATGVGGHEPERGAQQGRLARAVRADDGRHGARRERGVDVPEHRSGPVGHGHVRELERGDVPGGCHAASCGWRDD